MDTENRIVHNLQDRSARDQKVRSIGAKNGDIQRRDLGDQILNNKLSRLMDYRTFAYIRLIRQHIIRRVISHGEGLTVESVHLSDLTTLVIPSQ